MGSAKKATPGYKVGDQALTSEYANFKKEGDYFDVKMLSRGEMVSCKDSFSKDPDARRDVEIFRALNLETDDRMIFFIDGGLGNALRTSGVKDGDLFRVVWEGKEEVEGLGQVNQYKIYPITPDKK